MILYNSLTHRKEPFVPRFGNKVSMYTCGPTVYHFAHIGNLRSYIMEDVLEKFLRWSGYDVNRVMNITDVGHLSSDADTGEDKMLKGARREHKTVMEIAQFYTDAFFEDCRKLNIKRPDVVQPATGLIDDYIRIISRLLEREGYRVLRAYDGMEALDLALDPAVRLILIDVMMPKLDGLSALLRIREKRNLPVIVLSAKSEDTDKILGLSMGADDYVTKPFNPQELAARVRSQLRRYTLLGDVHAEERQGLIVNGRLTYDPDRRELRADGEAVKLTATETKIVDLLMRNPGRIFPAEEIYRRVWDGEAAYACENTVMVHIRRIREKIELNPKEPDYIKVVWGIGYKMEQHGT